MIEKHDKCSQKSPGDARSLAVCRSLTPAPGCSLSWSHCESRGPSLAKTLQKFLQSKTVQILGSLASRAGGGLEQWRGNCKILAKCPPSRPGTSVSTSARSAKLAGKTGGGDEYVLSKFASSHGAVGPALLANLCRQETLLFADTSLR